jgi:hypothetical protein
MRRLSRLSTSASLLDKAKVPPWGAGLSQRRHDATPDGTMRGSCTQGIELVVKSDYLRVRSRLYTCHQERLASVSLERGRCIGAERSRLEGRS